MGTSQIPYLLKRPYFPHATVSPWVSRPVSTITAFATVGDDELPSLTAHGRPQTSGPDHVGPDGQCLYTNRRLLMICVHDNLHIRAYLIAPNMQWYVENGVSPRTSDTYAYDTSNICDTHSLRGS